ncbi:MAG: hypothetical protein ACPGXY_02455 [Alphaproteobacteria bacterium]
MNLYRIIIASFLTVLASDASSASETASDCYDQSNGKRVNRPYPEEMAKSREQVASGKAFNWERCTGNTIAYRIRMHRHRGLNGDKAAREEEWEEAAGGISASWSVH